jgi:hypothetical protein
MPAFDSYNSLITVLQRYLNRDGDAELAADAPAFIELVEARLRRVLHARDTVVLPITINGETFELPPGIKELRFVTVEGRGRLDPVSFAEYADLKEVNGVGIPKFVAQAGNTLYFTPAPEKSFSGALVIDPEVEVLSASSQTNWVLSRYPDIYFYGALVEASPYLRDDTRVPMFEQRFSNAIAELEVLRDRKDYPNTPVARPRRVL